MDDVTYGHLDRTQLEGMKLEELKMLAADMGIKTAGMRKNEIVDAIAAEEVGIPLEDSADVSVEDETEGTPAEDESMEDAAEVELDDSKRIRRSYVGPTLPGGMMNHGKILQGTEKSINAYLAPILERFPQVEHLMVPTEKLQQAQRDVKSPGKLMHHYAEALKHEIKRRKGGEKA